MTDVNAWFSGLATIGGLAYFLLGFVTSLVMHIVYRKMHGKQPRISWQRGGIAVGVAAILIVSLQSSVAYNLASETASEVKQCQKEFNTTLRTRAKIAEQNDKWSQIQRKALGDWLHDILLPPPDIAALRKTNPNDPKVTDWGIKVTTYYSGLVQDAQKQQDAVLAERANHPLPDPLCGHD